MFEHYKHLFLAYHENQEIIDEPDEEAELKEIAAEELESIEE